MCKNKSKKAQDGADIYSWDSVIFTFDKFFDMAEVSSTLKRLRNKYRLIVMNDDTYEEVITFKLTRLSVYIGLSTIFILLVGLTVALIIFTPLKYYIPGAGSESSVEYMNLKFRIDSVEKQLDYQVQYINDLKTNMLGAGKEKLDTIMLHLPKVENTDD